MFRNLAANASAGRTCESRLLYCLLFVSRGGIRLGCWRRRRGLGGGGCTAKFWRRSRTVAGPKLGPLDCSHELAAHWCQWLHLLQRLATNLGRPGLSEG